MAKAEIFKYPIFSRIIKHYNVFPVDRTKVDSKSLFQALSIFENNEPNQLLIFPEGKVVKDENEIGKKGKLKEITLNFETSFGRKDVNRLTNFRILFYEYIVESRMPGKQIAFTDVVFSS